MQSLGDDPFCSGGFQPADGMPDFQHSAVGTVHFDGLWVVPTARQNTITLLMAG
ncbi:hypothetical protein [Haliscomenobacter hydrossis]|uniref:hypothetical protein n=1 Tax=Haliscomenobacter hydrossis TaxID=2350 RepID=UPI0003179434|nr:hypothetical protein [Haliscomenobacter hydrossis]